MQISSQKVFHFAPPQAFVNGMMVKSWLQVLTWITFQYALFAYAKKQ